MKLTATPIKEALRIAELQGSLGKTYFDQLPPIKMHKPEDTLPKKVSKK